MTFSRKCGEDDQNPCLDNLSRNETLHMISDNVEEDVARIAGGGVSKFEAKQIVGNRKLSSPPNHALLCPSTFFDL